MRFDIITMLPDGFDYLSKSVLGRAQKKGKIKVVIHNLRKWATDKYRTVDDRPYGGGVGLVMRVDVAYRALSAVLKKSPKTPNPPKTLTILMTPQGKLFTQADAERLAKRYERIVILAGRFEGYDERIRRLVDKEISIGDYILTGGELPAMVLVDAISRLIPGVLGKDESSRHESFTEGLLEYPQYTRPDEFCIKEVKPRILKEVSPRKVCWRVPQILKSGHHAQIAKWRKQKAEERTKKRRPDLLSR
jgi:tRNA (guanine37-N1)-methyltransferase